MKIGRHYLTMQNCILVSNNDLTKICVCVYIYIYTHTYTYTYLCVYICMGFPGGSVIKNLPATAGAAGSVPGSGISAGGGNGNPPQYYCLDYSSWGCKESDPTEQLSMHTQTQTHTHTHTYIYSTQPETKQIIGFRPSFRDLLILVIVKTIYFRFKYVLYIIYCYHKPG